MLKRYLLLVALSALAATAQSNPWIGTWKMNPAKSHMENIPDMSPMATMTLRITEQGDKEVLDFEGVDVNGKKFKQTLVQPIKGGKVEGPSEADFDAAILSVPDSHHWIYSYSKNGKPVAKRIVTLSEDGKTQIAQFSAQLPNGKTMIENDYMEKQ